MSEDKKNEVKKPRETSDEFCKRVGIRTVNEKGGVEFAPYHGPRKSAKPSRYVPQEPPGASQADERGTE
jgi:hypothetical protein